MLNKTETLGLLQPYFERGWSIHKACDRSGLCDDDTILEWCKEDIEIRKKIVSWQNLISENSIDNWKARVKDGDYQASKDWLERKEKDDFSLRNELTGKGGEDLMKDTIDLDKLSPEKLEQFKNILTEAEVSKGDLSK